MWVGQRGRGQRTGLRLVHLVELAPRMRPTRGLGDLLVHEQLAESGVAVGVQRAAEGLQVLLRMHALAIRRIREPHRRGRFALRRSLIAHVRPESCRLGAAAAGLEHWHRRVIGVQRRTREHVAPD